MKKLLLSLGTAATVAAPIAVAVSCGAIEEDNSLARKYHFGVQSEKGFLISITKQNDIAEPGQYYLTEKQARARHTFKVLKTPATSKKPAEYTTLTISSNLLPVPPKAKTAATGNSNLRILNKAPKQNHVKNPFTYVDKDGKIQNLSDDYVTISAGDPKNTYLFDKNVSKAFSKKKDVTDAITNILNNNPKEVFKYEDTKSKIKVSKQESATKVVNELLEKNTGLVSKTLTLDSDNKISKLELQTLPAKYMADTEKLVNMITINKDQNGAIKADSNAKRLISANGLHYSLASGKISFPVGLDKIISANQVEITYTSTTSSVIFNISLGDYKTSSGIKLVPDVQVTINAS